MAFAAARIIRDKENRKKFSNTSTKISSSRKVPLTMSTDSPEEFCIYYFGVTEKCIWFLLFWTSMTLRLISGEPEGSQPRLPRLSEHQGEKCEGRNDLLWYQYPAGSSSRKQSQVKRTTKCVKRIKGKKGKPDTFDLLVQIDRVGRGGLKCNISPVLVWVPTEPGEAPGLQGGLHVVRQGRGRGPHLQRVCDCSPHHGIQDTGYSDLPYPLDVTVISLDRKVLQLVKAVTEDRVNFSIEFNEFLKLISRQEEDNIQLNSLLEAFK